MGLEEEMLPAMALSERYLWQPEGKDIRVGLDLSVVDRLLREVMSAFGSTPRRGVEIGGVLLGCVEEDGTLAITDYVRVECAHDLGSTYSLTEEEQERFAAVVRQRQRSEDNSRYAIGYFRSHTREGLGLSHEDLLLINEHFGEGTGLVLLVKPYATRACRAGLFFREDSGIRQESSYREFPFRREELAAGPAADMAAAENDTISAVAVSRPNESFSHVAADEAWVRNPLSSASSTGVLGINQPPPEPDAGGEPQRKRRGWILLPLSFVFLLLGVFLGIQVSISIGQRLPSALRPVDPFGVSLTATPSGESIHLRWDRDSGAVKSARGGRLLITDGGAEKTVVLTSEQVRYGSVIYRRGSPQVQFRFEVDVRERVTLTETLDFRAP